MTMEEWLKTESQPQLSMRITWSASLNPTRGAEFPILQNCCGMGAGELAFLTRLPGDVDEADVDAILGEQLP